ncbi:polyhydroxyalkanoic acid system family protein [Aquabacter cavernae]|uniref:polyhydroxyalkanoic acid system family protein n=1 Tax=Aquabacter cavernae TaxID=2496029 RepID=UPI000F8F7D1D|nr:polyhydroxyalkanoic acid system family protein [Aquabacter cavernae]
MAQPLTVSIPHRLGKAEATRRLQTGLSSVRERFGDKLSVMQETWTGDHLDFRVAVMGHEAAGKLDVAEDAVHLEVTLPWLLHLMAEKAKALIDRQGRILLEKK